MNKVNKLQEYTVEHREYSPIFYNNYEQSITYEDFESVCCTPETNIVNQLYFNLRKKERGAFHLTVQTHLRWNILKPPFS